MENEIPPSRTQAIIGLTTEFKLFRQEIGSSVKKIEEITEKHSKEIWGTDDANIGIKAKVTSIVIDRAKEKLDEEKRLREEGENRRIFRTIIAVPIVGVTVEWFVKLINYVQQAK